MRKMKSEMVRAVKKCIQSRVEAPTFPDNVAVTKDLQIHENVLRKMGSRVSRSDAYGLPGW